MKDLIKTKFDEVIQNDFLNLFISKEIFNNGDFNYHVAIAIEDQSSYDNSFEDKPFTIKSVIIKTPEFTQQDKDWFDLEQDDEITPYDIFDYGLYANLDANGNGQFKTFEEGYKESQKFAKQLDVYTSMLGFYLDRPMNLTGNTGWDFLEGKL